VSGEWACPGDVSRYSLPPTQSGREFEEVNDEKYQAFRVVIAGPGYDPSLRSWQCWFHVTPLNGEWEDRFTFAVSITDPYARRTPDRRSGETLAFEEGRAWTHGLVDLGRIREGIIERQIRSSEWGPLFGDEDLSEEELRRELLNALRRQTRALDINSSSIGIDVDGIASVLGVRSETMRGILRELIVEGLVEPYGDTFGVAATSVRNAAEGARSWAGPLPGRSWQARRSGSAIVHRASRSVYRPVRGKD